MIYLADIRGCTEEALLPLVCKERRDYAAKYKQSADRIRSLAVATLLGIALKQEGYIDILPAEFTHDEKQKPVLSSQLVDITKIEKEGKNEEVNIKHDSPCFSLSHAGDYVAVAVDTLPVGIDIERNRPYKASLAKRYFSKEEQELPLPFTQIWTLKESFLKVTGMGLSFGLDTFSVIRDPNETAGEEQELTSFLYRQDFDDHHYAGRLLPAPDGYAFSVCFLLESKLAKAPLKDDICYVNLENYAAE